MKKKMKEIIIIVAICLVALFSTTGCGFCSWCGENTGSSCVNCGTSTATSCLQCMKCTGCTSWCFGCAGGCFDSCNSCI